MRRGNAGFTLFEVVITLAILAIVMAIVYGSLISVTMSTVEARAAIEETKLKDFVVRHLRQNLAQAVHGWLPGAADRLTPGEDEDVSAIAFGFLGEDERGPGGAADTLEFITRAPMPGAVVLPGSLKRVTYSVTDETSDDIPVIGPYDPDHPPVAYLEAIEESVLGPSSGDDAGGLDIGAGGGEGAVSWRLPIRSMDILYYDGEEWVEEWDADEEGRLPWAVDIRINLASMDGREDEDRFTFASDRDEGPGAAADLQLIVTLPAGMGLTEAPPIFDAPELPWRRKP